MSQKISDFWWVYFYTLQMNFIIFSRLVSLLSSFEIQNPDLHSPSPCKNKRIRRFKLQNGYFWNQEVMKPKTILVLSSTVTTRPKLIVNFPRKTCWKADSQGRKEGRFFEMITSLIIDIIFQKEKIWLLVTQFSLKSTVKFFPIWIYLDLKPWRN